MGEARSGGAGRTQGPRGGLSRNKVAVGESAAGSPPNGAYSPTGPICWQARGLVAQPGRAPPLQGGGLGFKSRRVHYFRAPGDESRRGRVDALYGQVKPCRGLSPDAYWGRLSRRLSRPVDGSARAPTKGVPSCEKPGGGARSRRTRDPRMGYPVPSGTLPLGSGNAGKGNIRVPAGKESKRDAVSRGDRKRQSPNRTPWGNPRGMWCCRCSPLAPEG